MTAAAVAAIVAFLPAIADPGEAHVRLHHLAHAGQFFFGMAVGITLASLPSVFESMERRRSAAEWGLAAAIVAPAVMLLTDGAALLRVAGPPSGAPRALPRRLRRPRAPDGVRMRLPRPRDGLGRLRGQLRHGPPLRARRDRRLVMAEKTPGDGLIRALLLGLLAGAVLLGLLVAAYEIGRNQESSDGSALTAPTASAPAATTAPGGTTAPAGTTARAPSGAALIAVGRGLYASSGCSGCHSLDGSSGVGPTFKGLAGGQVTLAGGQTLTADDAYLAKSMQTPDAQLVEGYSAGAMPDLGLSDADVAALVAFIHAQR